MQGVERLTQKTDNSQFSFEGHPNNTTKVHLQTLYSFGFRSVCFGVQDYNIRVQKAIHRIQPFENVKNVTEWAREIGYTSIGHDIIYGLPFQSLSDVKTTLAKTTMLQPDRIAFYSYAHVPWRKGNGQRGFQDSDLPTAAAKKIHYETGKTVLKQQGYQDIGMDHFAYPTDSLALAAKNGSLHRNFMGYTASKAGLLLGLGVSSISDSWTGFAQNVKSIEAYEHLITHNIIPLDQGHILTEKDLCIRKHILNLMCSFQTSWNNLEDYIPELESITKRLEVMETDGLVKISSKKLLVTPKGRPFIRNICMAFDLYLHKQKMETPLFSMTV